MGVFTHEVGNGTNSYDHRLWRGALLKAVVRHGNGLIVSLKVLLRRPTTTGAPFSLSTHWTISVSDAPSHLDQLPYRRLTLCSAKHSHSILAVDAPTACENLDDSVWFRSVHGSSLQTRVGLVGAVPA